MLLLDQALENKKFDTRLVERNIKRGVIQLKDAEQAESALADDAENAEWQNLDELANQSGE